MVAILIPGITESFGLEVSRMLKVFVILMFGASAMLVTFPAASQPAENLKVAVSGFEPNIIQGPNGAITGLDAEVWSEIARKIGVGYNIQVIQRVPDLLAAVQAGEVDVAFGGITMTADRHQTIDFSYSYMESGLMVAVDSDDAEPTFWAQCQNMIKRFFFNKGLLMAVCLLFTAIGVFGFLLYLCERSRHGSHVRPGLLEGMHDASWLVWAVMTTIGWGDKIAQTVIGRFLTIPAFFAGAIVNGLMVAAITTIMTVSALQENVVGSISDLGGLRVATESGTTSETALTVAGVQNVVLVGDIHEAYDLLVTDKVDAVVYDMPSIRYFAKSDHDGKQIATGPLVNREDYAFVLPKDSPFRDEVNRAILEMRESGLLEAITRKWVGESSP